ncbi:MAG: radical SAM protein [Oscillospiraceae bacterium]|jgi:radical SAM protein with 4Fe4S-binding SPASM domain|nr:radical SAM protein [Oscillospiraceae bacterium]
MRQLKKAYLEITNLCNLNCAFCPGTRRPQGFLAPEDFRSFGEKLRPHTEYLYLHLMGEPLLHPRLEELLAHGEELGFKVMITTNGTLLDRQGALLWRSLAVEKVSISLHSFEGSGGQGLEDYLEQCIRFARRAAGAGKRCALRLWNLDGADTRGANRRNGEILSALERAFPRPWREGRRGTTLASNVFLEWGEKFDWPDLSVPPSDRPAFCYGLRDQVGVLWNGTVVPCCLDHEGDVTLGSLRTQTLEEILNSPRAQAIYNGFSQGRANEALCRRCGFAKRFR